MTWGSVAWFVAGNIVMLALIVVLAIKDARRKAATSRPPRRPPNGADRALADAYSTLSAIETCGSLEMARRIARRGLRKIGGAG